MCVNVREREGGREGGREEGGREGGRKEGARILEGREGMSAQHRLATI